MKPQQLISEPFVARTAFRFIASKPLEVQVLSVGEFGTKRVKHLGITGALHNPGGNSL